MDQFFSGGVAICYALPVLWITPCLQIMARRHESHETRKSRILKTDSQETPRSRGGVCLRLPCWFLLFISLVCLDNSKMQHITFYFFCLTINLYTVKQNAAVMRKPRSRLHKRYTMFKKCLLLTCIVFKKINQFKQKILNLQVNAS